MNQNPGVEEERPLIRTRTLVLVCGVVVVLAGLAIAASVRARRLHDAAEDQVFAWSSRLDADKDETTRRWRRWPDPILPEADPWGRPLRVRYDASPHTERLTVSSDGPDGRQWTRDDLSWSVTNIEWLAMAKDGADAVEEVAGAATRGLVGGAIEGVTDHLPKKVRDSLGIPSGQNPPAEKPPSK